VGLNVSEKRFIQKSLFENANWLYPRSALLFPRPQWKGIARKIINIFRKKSEGIEIKAFLEDKQEITASFECLENPKKIQEEYGRLVENYQNITSLPT